MNSSPIISLAGFGVICWLATYLGASILFAREAWAKRNLLRVNAFAAGALLALAFGDLLPEALNKDPSNGALWAFAGFLALYLVETFVVVHSGVEFEFPDHGDKNHFHHHSKGMSVPLGLSLHGLADGIVVGLTLTVSGTLALVTAFGVMLHRFPEGMATGSMLLESLGPKKARRAVMLLGLAPLVGAFAALLFLPHVESVQGPLLGLAAGALLYIAASDLVPQTHGAGSKLNALLLLLGVAFLLGVGHFIPVMANLWTPG